jgi:hypothetical protein
MDTPEKAETPVAFDGDEGFRIVVPQAARQDYEATYVASVN